MNCWSSCRGCDAVSDGPDRSIPWMLCRRRWCRPSLSRSCRLCCRWRRHHPYAAWDGRDREVDPAGPNRIPCCCRRCLRFRNLRNDACGAGWARRFGRHRIRRSSPLAPARAWAWAAASTCRIPPMPPAPGRHYRCRRGPQACRPAGAGTRPRLRGQAARAGQGRFPRPGVPARRRRRRARCGWPWDGPASPVHSSTATARSVGVFLFALVIWPGYCARAEQSSGQRGSSQRRCRYPQASWTLR